MSLAFIMPDEEQQRFLQRAKKSLEDLRGDQRANVWHLLQSWRIGNGSYFETFRAGLNRAICKTRNNNP